MKILWSALALVAAAAFAHDDESMAREGSGTSWLPDSSPIYALMQMYGGDMLMLHGSIDPRYTHVGSDRDLSAAGRGSNAKLDAPSMFMAMWTHPLGEASQLGLRAMASLDPLLEQDYGYPLLYQTGETYGGQPLHDRQHPHDLLAELSAIYSVRTSGRQSASLYLGYPGEPALGPPAFMHRLSAMDSPDAPISHHWQDSTHISFGVATLGYSFGDWKIEGSAFNGREPDERRYAFDAPRLSSYSGRVSWNPTANLSLQASYGFVRGPEALEPDVDVHRTTASAMFNWPLGDDRNWATSLVWGQNRESTGEVTDAYLVESAWQRDADTIYGRIERVGKTGHELVLAPPLEDGTYGVVSAALGYVHDLVHGSGLDVGLGGQLTVDANPRALDPVYGGTSHLSWQVFFRIRPSRL